MRERAKYIGWDYVKAVLREYGEYKNNPEKCRLKPFQIEAVEKTLEEVKAMSNPDERLKMIELVFWERSHTLQGAALKVYVSYETAVLWHKKIVERLGVNLGIF